jgi:hypothetical protein
MGSSGYAAPLVAAATGADMASAEQWDQEQEAKGLSLLKEQRSTAIAQQEVANIMKLVDKGMLPEATAWWKKVREENPALNLPDIQFNTSSDKEIQITDGKDGQKYGVDKRKFAAAMKEIQDNPESPLKNDPTYGGAVLPIGGKKSLKTKPKDDVIEVGAGGGMLRKMRYNEETDRFDIPVGEPYPKFNPKGEGGSANPLKSHQMTAIRSEVNSMFLPYVSEDLKNAIGDLGGEPAVSRVRSGLSGDMARTMDSAHEEMEDLVSKGTLPKKAANIVREKYKSQLGNASKASLTKGKTYTDLYNEIKGYETAPEAVAHLKNKYGYNEQQAIEIVREGRKAGAF